MSAERISRRVSGVTAILAAVASISWIVLNGLTRGGLDADAAAVSPSVIRLGQLLMVSWNLLLIPAALFLWRWLEHRNPHLMLLYTVCGIASLLFWAYGGATRGITQVLETTYLLLSGVWWLGVGSVLRDERKGLGIFTMVLGSLTLIDAVVTFLEPVPFFLLPIAGLKLPLSLIWVVWVGVALLARPAAESATAMAPNQAA